MDAPLPVPERDEAPRLVVSRRVDEFVVAAVERVGFPDTPDAEILGILRKCLVQDFVEKPAVRNAKRAHGGEGLGEGFCGADDGSGVHKKAAGKWPPRLSKEDAKGPERFVFREKDIA